MIRITILCEPYDLHESEYYLEGYQKPIMDFNIRGGACVFIQNGLHFTPIQPPHPVNESCWFYIKTKDNVQRLFGCIYRSPNSPEVNNHNLLMNIKWAQETYTEIVLIGDFNVPSINWENDTATTNYGQNLLDCINDNYLEQLVTEPTRFRTGNIPSLLDLIITSDPNIISDLKITDPFGKSDHVSLVFYLHNAICRNKNKSIQRYNY